MAHVIKLYYNNDCTVKPHSEEHFIILLESYLGTLLSYNLF